MTLYFSRLTLNRTPSNDALKALIDPPEMNRKTDAHHRLLWTVFSDGPERERDFLWRAEPNGRFYTLSHRPPLSHELFEPPEVKEYSPSLKPGDHLAFLLRANAVRSVPGELIDPNGKKRKRGTKVDVAMHLLRNIPGRKGLRDGDESRRAPERFKLATEASCEWLKKQGQANGFKALESHFVLDDYSTVTLPGYRGKRKGEPRFGIFDMKGLIEVQEPELLLSKLATGFGRAKSYGCGLMMLRRV